MTPTIWVARCLRWASEKLILRLWIRSNRVPSLTNYMARHSWGGFVMAPIMRTIFGCLYLASMLTSLLNYSSSCSLMLGLKTFLIATSKSKYFPLWIVLNPPIDICSPICKSAILRVRTPFTASRSGSNYWLSCFDLSLRLAVVGLSSSLTPKFH